MNHMPLRDPEAELERKRTIAQNKCLHKYIAELAKEMAGAGLDMRTTVKLPIIPTPENVKENMIMPVMESLYPGMESTTELNTKQIQALYEVLNAATADRLGISLMWPDRYNGGNCS